jgi:hypothetical protein
MLVTFKYQLKIHTLMHSIWIKYRDNNWYVVNNTDILWAVSGFIGFTAGAWSVML